MTSILLDTVNDIVSLEGVSFAFEFVETVHADMLSREVGLGETPKASVTA